MGVDEAGMEQPPGGGDHGGTLGGGATGRPELADRIALDQDVGRLGGGGGDVEHKPAAQNRMAHGNVSAKADPMIDRSAIVDERAWARRNAERHRRAARGG